MLVSSLQALVNFLKATFPGVQKVYDNTPAGRVKRPSFYVEFVSSDDTDLNRLIYGSQITWQIVYFAPVDDEHNPDRADQFTIAGKLKKALMEVMYLTGPDGIIFRILDVSGGPRDAEVYITVRLEAEEARPQTQYDLMLDVQNVVKS